MKKRTLSLMLAAAMVLGSLTGCGTGQKEDSKETAAVTEGGHQSLPLQRHRKLGHRQKMGRKGYMHLYPRQQRTPYSF